MCILCTRLHIISFNFIIVVSCSFVICRHLGCVVGRCTRPIGSMRVGDVKQEKGIQVHWQAG